MTDGASRSDPSAFRRPLPASCGPTVWLVSGVLAVTDASLPAALHKLADHAELCIPGSLTSPVGGIILHGRLKVTWRIAVPTDEQVPAFVEERDPAVSYRLMTITVTTYADSA